MVLRAATPNDFRDAATLRVFLGEGPVVTGSLTAAFPGGHLPGSIGSILLFAGPGEAQMAPLPALFAACHRALRRDGRIAVTVENRLYRAFAKPSLRAVVRALRAAGFADIVVFAVSPSAGAPRDVRPLSLRERWLTPGYLVTANANQSAGTSLLDAIIHALDQQLGGRAETARWSIARVASSSKQKSIAFVGSGEAQIVVRIPQSAAAQAAEANAHGLLEKLKDNSAIAGRVPDPILSGSVGGQPFFVERHVAGVPLATALRRSNRAAYVREADAFLRALNPDLAHSAAMTVPVNLVQPMLERVLTCVADAALRRKAQALFDESLSGAASRTGIVHGDFSTSNIFVAAGRITGVIDWEDGLRTAPPVLDAFNYLDSVHRHCGGDLTLADTIPLLASGVWPVPEEFEFLKEFFRFCGIDFRFRRGFALLYWLYHVGPQLNFASAGQGPNARVEAVLQRFLD